MACRSLPKRTAAHSFFRQANPSPDCWWEFESQGLIDPAAEVGDYLPEAKDPVTATARFNRSLICRPRLHLSRITTTKRDPLPVTAVPLGGIRLRPPSQNPRGWPNFCYPSRAQATHGQVFRYLSPNSDLLGIIVERATNHRFADLVSARIWQPLGCAHNAYITVDHKGAARSAGGLCVHPFDLALLGSAIGQAAAGEDHPVIPRKWINDTLSNGNLDAWQSGDFANFLPNGNYRNQWYLNDSGSPAIPAIGIHGQWLTSSQSQTDRKVFFRGATGR